MPKLPRTVINALIDVEIKPNLQANGETRFLPSRVPPPPLSPQVEIVDGVYKKIHQRQNLMSGEWEDLFQSHDPATKALAFVVYLRTQSTPAMPQIVVIGVQSDGLKNALKACLKQVNEIFDHRPMV